MDADPFVGQQLAHYQIEEHVGQGGMGAVYRAWDTQLRRRVAIKILNASSERSAEMRARLLVEARSAAGLNHPNIVTIYEIGRTEKLDYIAMEFVQGRTLHAVIDGRPMPLEVALDYGAQIADAIAAAHSAGVIHRDLKPANIMIGERGGLKVLDFGLAKQDDQPNASGATQTLEALTLRGTTLGTPSYMSPEQAQGKQVDSRSDIFSLGAILYEMLTGRRAFPGDSLAAVMAAILMVDPPPVSTVRPVPEELDRLIARCMRKDVERRQQHAGDLKIALQEFAAEARVGARLQSVSGVVPAAPIPSQVSAAVVSAQSVAAPSARTVAVESQAPKRRRWPIVAAAVAVAGGVVAGGLYWDRRPLPNPFAGAELFRVTSDTGLAISPALSRDGRLVAYASDRGNESNLQIWVQQLSGGTPFQLTNGDADNTEPTFSPDGQLIAFRSERDGGGVYVVPTLGGEARLIARQARGPRFSPDGKKIAYSTDGAGTTGNIFLVDVKGDPKPQPFHPEFPMARSPLWSPDGKSILFVGVQEGGSAHTPGAMRQTDWWIAPADGGPASPTGGYAIIRQHHFVPQDPAAWLPGNRLLLSAVRESAASLWLLDMPRAGRPLEYPTRLTFGTNADQDPAFSGDAPANFQVAFASIEKRTDIWELPVDANRGVVKGALKRLTEGRGSESTQITASADGRRIAFLSDRSGKTQPWIRDMSTGRQVSVSGGSGTFWQPHLSPDGKSLAWGVFENGVITRTRRATVEPDGQIGIPEPLCDQCGPISSWSPDGRRVVYSYGNPNRGAIYELDTGRKYDLLIAPGMDTWGGRFSPDGNWVTMNVTPPGKPSQLYVARFDPDRRQPVPFTEWVPLTDGAAWDDKSRWSPDGNSMYFVSERDGYRCIWRQPLDPESKRPSGDAAAVMHFHEARLSLRNVGMGPLAIVVTRDRLIFSLGERTGNIWLLRRPRTE